MPSSDKYIKAVYCIAWNASSGKHWQIDLHLAKITFQNFTCNIFSRVTWIKKFYNKGESVNHQCRFIIIPLDNTNLTISHLSSPTEKMYSKAIELTNTDIAISQVTYILPIETHACTNAYT